MAQQTAPPPEPAAGAARLSVQANLVTVPAQVFDKKGMVTTLQKTDFALSVDGKPQTIRYFDHDNDQPLTVGLLVDTSRSQTDVLDEERKASDRFLESLLKPGTPARAADRAFVLQFAHGAELLQDVTDSHALLAAGLKEIGTQAPGSSDETASTDGTDSRDERQGNASGTGGNPGNSSPGYGRRGGYPGGNGNPTRRDDRARGGTVLYDAVYLASEDVLERQKGRRALVLLTDGVDRHSKESLTDAIEAAQRADTVVYAIYYKGHEDRGGFGNGPGGYGYPGYGRPGYPGSGGRPGSDGTYADPDGKKILDRICTETGGRMFEVKGKGGVEAIYTEIGDELRSQYRLGFTPGFEAAGKGYHKIELSLTNPANNKFELQTRDGYYGSSANAK